VSRLTREADELVRAGRSALRPTSADRERVLEALLPRVADNPAAQGFDASAPAPRATRTMLAKASVVAVGLGLTGAGLFLTLREQPPSPKPAPSIIAIAPSASPAPMPEQSASAAPSETPVGTPAKGAAVAPRSDDRLAQEVAILSRAGSELHAGRAGAALKLLDEHRRKFPGGVLAQERMAARVRALCMLGRMQEAQAELARLSKLSPNSPHEARARKACGNALTEKD
jgi:hypothetical protein